jgi:hypothetical protein
MTRSAAVVLAVSVVLLSLSCASRPPQAQLLEPDFVVRQIGTLPFAARHVTGPIPVTLAVDVINKSDEELTLEQVRLETVGLGAYILPATSRPFDRLIRARHVETVELSLNASAQDTIQGANGPVTIRGTAYFKSPYGKFQKTFMQQVNDGMKGQPLAH